MIKTYNLTKKFNDFTALSNVSCSIPKGCIYGMVGSNGAGKSTFLRLLTGVYKADSGKIYIDDQPVYENPDVKKRICYVPDELYFLPSASMKRMAKLFSSVYEKFDMERFTTLASKFNLNPDKNISTFSKGMKRQAAIILALSSKPDYLFFDETFDGLDPILRNFVKGLICTDVIDNQTTLIITSHSLRELEDICDQLALLHKGGLVLENDINNLKTSQFKIQVALRDDYDAGIFTPLGLDIHNIKKSGSVTNMIICGDYDTTVNKLKTLNPVLLEALPLTLEEIFTFEMEALGYVFDNIPD